MTWAQCVVADTPLRGDAGVWVGKLNELIEAVWIILGLIRYCR